MREGWGGKVGAWGDGRLRSVDCSRSRVRRVEGRDLAVVHVVMAVTFLVRPGRTPTPAGWMQRVNTAAGLWGTYSGRDLVLERVRATWGTIRVVRTEIAQPPVY